MDGSATDPETPAAAAEPGTATAPHASLQNTAQAPEYLLCDRVAAATIAESHLTDRRGRCETALAPPSQPARHWSLQSLEYPRAPIAPHPAAQTHAPAARAAASAADAVASPQSHPVGSCPHR